MKKFITAIWGMLLVGGVMAEKVPFETAHRAATQFITLQKQSATTVQLTLSPTHKEVSEMYLFNVDNGGFVIVAADNRVRPILAYSESTTLSDTLPEHMVAWLQGYAEEISYLRDIKAEASPAVQAEWSALLNAPGNTPLFTTVVSPMLTTTWKQGAPFNTLCPYDSTANQRTIVGCVAIAMAQMMKYWNHPTQGTGSYSYNHSTYGTQSANFGNTTYDWNNMPNSLTSTSPTVNVNAVATLVYHAGVSVKMNYGTSSSGATTVSAQSLTTVTAERALRTFFRYDKALHSMRKAALSDSLWMALIDAELTVGRPVIYAGRDASSGHAFVCDGSNNAGFYHFNWGWGGYCDGYYQIGALNPSSGGSGGNVTSRYNLENKVILGIQPDTVLSGSHAITAIAANSSYGSVSGSGTYNYGDTVKLTASAANGYRFARWSDGMCYNPRNIIVGGDKTFTAIFEPLTGDTLRYDNGIYQTSWGYSTARPYYWGLQFEPATLTGHTQLDAVMVYLKPGSYRMTVYQGTTPSDSTLLDSLSITATGDDEWYTLTLTSPLAVNPSLPLWIVMYNDDCTYPACSGTYCGNALAAYGNTNGTTWSPSNNERTFLIRGIFSTPPITHQVTAVSSNPQAGNVDGSGNYILGSLVTLTANATPCHSFNHWSDGVTENPRALWVQSDTTVTAYFDVVTYHSLQTLVACDSLTWLDGITYLSSTNNAEITLASVEGCDSVVSMTLTLGHSSCDTLTVDTTAAITWEGNTYTESGLYTQTYQTSEGCDSVKVLQLTIYEVPDTTTGITTPDIETIILYPNPTTDIVQIRLDKVTSVEVYDIDGRQVAHSTASQTVNLGHLPEGTYLLRVTAAKGIGTYRIMKK